MKKKITDIWKFLTYDIWRITEDEVTRTKFSLYNIIKTIYLCINRFTKDRMANKASALTYSTLLAIVPILAILFAVARGFGFDNLMEHQFRNGFGGNIETTEAILSFVNSYLSPVMKFMIRLIPFVLTWMMFTGLYIFMPNTKVKFKHALIAGILAGSAYQAFQFLYINSQLWVSKYNAIYGSFAALPLFLLWLQISWTICLFGAELAYAGQNIRSFSFDQDTRNISRRYRDFISILIMSLIAKRFEKNDPPYTAAEISEEHQIPIRLTNQVLYQLQEIDLIHEVVTDQKSEDIGYQPSMDINQLNVAILLDRLDTYGSENFKIDKDEEFSDEWKVLTESREEYYKKASKVLLKDL